MDLPNCWFKGVVTPDKAIFSLSHLESGPSAGLGLLRFPGLDVGASHRVRCLAREQLPLHAVPWELSGKVLVEMGLRAPTMRPALAVIIELDRV